MPTRLNPCMAIQTGSAALDRMVERLGSTADPKRRYEYVLWLAKKLKPMPADQQTEEIKVKGCVSQVFVRGALDGTVDGPYLRGINLPRATLGGDERVDVLGRLLFPRRLGDEIYFRQGQLRSHC